MRSSENHGKGYLIGLPQHRLASVEDLEEIHREEMVGWSDKQLQTAIIRLGAVKKRSADQESLMSFLIDAAMKRRQDEGAHGILRGF